MPVVAIEAGNTAMVHAAVQASVVFVHLTINPPVGVVKAGLEQRRDRPAPGARSFAIALPRERQAGTPAICFVPPPTIWPVWNIPPMPPDSPRALRAASEANATIR
jgi:hypothetical protein